MSDAETPSDIALAMAHDLVSRDFRLMENWDDGEASAITGPTMCNDESVVEPPAARQSGIAGARATYDWLHPPIPNCDGRSTASSPTETGRSRRRRCPAARPDLS